MYVCLCKGITDKQIKTAIEEGATTISKLRKALDVAAQCGKCGTMTREILQETLSSKATHSIPLVNGFPQFYALG